MSRLLSIIAFTILLRVMVGCSGSDPHAEALLDRADSLMETDPATALDLLREADTLPFTDRPLRARHAMLLSQAFDKNDVAVESDSIISIAYNYYSTRTDSPELMKTLFYKGRQEYNWGNYPQSIITAMEALESARNNNDVYWMAKSEELMADNYRESFYHEEEFKMRELAAVHYKDAGYILNHRYALLECGGALINNGNKQKGLNLIDSLESLPTNNHLDSLFLKDCLRNSIVVLISDSLNAAKNKYRKLEKMNIHYNKSIIDLIAEAKLNIDEPVFVDSILEAACQQRTCTYDSLEIDRFRTNYYIHHNRIADALNSLQNVFWEQNDIATDIINQSIVIAQRDYFNQKSTHMADTARIRQNIILTIIIISLFSAIAGFVIIRMRIKLKDNEIEMKIHEIELLNSQLNQQIPCLPSPQNANPTDGKTIYTLFRKQFNTINKLIDEYYMNRDSPILKNSILNVVEKELQSLTSAKNIQALKLQINESLDGIIDKIKSQMPELKESDITFISFIIAGFSARAIGLLCKIKYTTVYSKKARLYERISKSDAVDKDIFLQYFN